MILFQRFGLLIKLFIFSNGLWDVVESIENIHEQVLLQY
jgi:hypothetical protein